MTSLSLLRFLPVLALALAPHPAATPAPAPPERPAFWMDLLTAEPLESEEDLWNDLATVDIVFTGETHRLERHHLLQKEIVTRLLATGRPLLLGLEQVEARHQPELDRLNRGEIDFNTFAEQIRWKEQWPGYPDYRDTILTAIQGGARVVGLNAPREIIRQVGQTGLDGLLPEQRKTLPGRIHTDDPPYERLMNLLLSVHSTFDPQFLRHVFEAQVARDDTMAHSLVQALTSTQPREGKRPMAIAITGAGHVQFGLGTPDRVLWRAPELQTRILLLSESGDLVLTPMEKAMRREIQIRHGDLLFIRRPVGDYAHVKAWNPAADPGS